MMSTCKSKLPFKPHDLGIYFPDSKMLEYATPNQGVCIGQAYEMIGGSEPMFKWRELGTNEIVWAQQYWFVPLDALSSVENQSKSVRIRQVDYLYIDRTEYPLYFVRTDDEPRGFNDYPEATLATRNLFIGRTYRVLSWLVPGKVLQLEGIRGAYYADLFEAAPVPQCDSPQPQLSHAYVDWMTEVPSPLQTPQSLYLHDYGVYLPSEELLQLSPHNMGAVVGQVFELVGGVTPALQWRELGTETDAIYRAHRDWFVPLLSLPEVDRQFEFAQMRLIDHLHIPRGELPLYLSMTEWESTDYFRAYPQVTLSTRKLLPRKTYRVSKWLVARKVLQFEGIEGAYYAGLFEVPQN